jgi:antirestriction protein ArdC
MVASSKTASSESVRSTIEGLADYLASQFEEIARTRIWSAPWRKVPRCRNPMTDGGDHEFSYLNSMLFWRTMQDKGYKYPLWATYKQWNKDGRRVKRGEHHTKGLRPNKSSLAGQEVEDGNDDYLKYITVPYFNIEQTDGQIPAGASHTVVSPRPFADLVVRSLGIEVKHDAPRAVYTHVEDYINLPRRDCFEDDHNGSATGHYYGTLLHEIVHWTGRYNRLKRREKGELRERKSPEYAFEELVAEFGSAQLCTDLEVTDAITEDHVEYLAHWAANLRASPGDLLRAVGQAREATEFILAGTGKAVLREHVGVLDAYPRTQIMEAFQAKFPNGDAVLRAMIKRQLLTEPSMTAPLLNRGPKWGGLDGTSLSRFFASITGYHLP